MKQMLTKMKMLGTRPMRLGKLPGAQADGFQPKIPASFKSLEEARNSLDYHWNCCIHMFEDVKNDIGTLKSPKPPNLSILGQSHLDKFEQWGAAFEAFLLLHDSNIDAKSMQGARVLQVSQTFAMATIRASPYFGSTSEMVWDDLLPYFQRVVSLCEQMSKAYDLDIRNYPENRPMFCLDMNVVAPLYAVSHKCRDPILRRKAVDLLYLHPRQEGIWDSILTARVAEQLIKIEEEGLDEVNCCKDVPDWARISSAEVKFDLEGRLGTVKYSRERSAGERKREDLEVKFAW